MLAANIAEPKNISLFALSILILTLLYKLVTIPVTINSIKTQRINLKMQPKMKEIQKKYKNDPQKQQIEMQKLQQEHGFSPFSSCLPLLIQMFLILALFRVMREPGQYMGIENIAKNFFWISDLTKRDPYLWGLPLILGITQYLSFEVMNMQTPNTKDKKAEDDPAQAMNNSMKYVMPLMMFFFARSYQAGLALYWGFSNIIEIIIRFVLNRIYAKEDEVTPQKKKGAK